MSSTISVSAFSQECNIKMMLLAHVTMKVRGIYMHLPENDSQWHPKNVTMLRKLLIYWFSTYVERNALILCGILNIRINRILGVLWFLTLGLMMLVIFKGWASTSCIAPMAISIKKGMLAYLVFTLLFNYNEHFLSFCIPLLLL